MDEDCLRLTSYFRERQRADDRSLAGALTDLYAGSEVAASIVLRGTEGSSAAVAVGSRPDVEVLLRRALELAGPELATIEQIRLLTGDIEPLGPGEESGEAARLTVHFGRQDRVYQVPAFEVVCELLYRRGIAGAIVLPGIDGTVHGRRQHPRLFRHAADTPLMAIAVGSWKQVATVLPELGSLFRHPVMTVERVQLCQPDEHLIGSPQVLPDSEPAGIPSLLKLMVHTSEAARHDGQPADRAIARQLTAAGLENVTTVHGIWGFHTDHAPHGDHFPHRSRHLPAVTTAIGRPERISAVLDAVGTLTDGRGLVTVQTVLAVRQVPTADSGR